jgi:VIT1/CCC1 family predicted Fe2+/Mn2+ transporter
MKSKNLPKWIQSLLRVHEKIGELSFGITSGILTTIGLMTGVNAATSSQLSVVAAIASIAVADSLSDAFGMYMSKVSERGNDSGAAVRYAAGTLVGKFIFPLTFIVPIFLFPLEIGIAIDLVWGGIALALLSAEQAIVSQSSVIKTVGRNLLLAAVIVILSAIVGSIVSGMG